MSSLVDALLASGRKGGIVSLLIAAGLFGITLVDYVSTNGFFIAIPAIALVFVLVGVLLVVHGNPETAEIGRSKAKPLEKAFEDRLRNSDRPFYVCTRCRSMPDQQFCETCGGSMDVLEIRDDEDLRLAVISMT